MEVITTKEFKDLIELCKQAVMKARASNEGQGAMERRWLEAHADSYENPKYRIQLFVLEGSPAKGYVVIDYGHHRVQAFDVRGKRLKHLKTGF
jgi:hypothetical protein